MCTHVYVTINKEDMNISESKGYMKGAGEKKGKKANYAIIISKNY